MKNYASASCRCAQTPGTPAVVAEHPPLSAEPSGFGAENVESVRHQLAADGWSTPIWATDVGRHGADRVMFHASGCYACPEVEGDRCVVLEVSREDRRTGGQIVVGQDDIVVAGVLLCPCAGDQLASALSSVAGPYSQRAWSEGCDPSQRLVRLESEDNQ